MIALAEDGVIERTITFLDENKIELCKNDAFGSSICLKRVTDEKKEQIKKKVGP